MRVYGEGLTVEPPTRSFEWNGRENLVSFSVAVATGAMATTTQLYFDAFIEGVSVASILLDLRIGPDASDAQPNVSVSRPVSTAFASYASKDAPLVAQCLSALKRWDAGIDVFIDCLDLTPNEQWQEELERVIPTKDAFLLFWSVNARNSKWVAWELRTVQSKRGLACVRPMPLDDPELAPPPDELKHLHFRDRYMMAKQGFLRLANVRTP